MRQISEFSFGFGFTRELLAQIPRADAVPFFPSLRQEGQLGYDLRIGFPGLPVFIQFKIAEGLTRSSSKFWQDYSRPYFRFDVYSRKRSRQHDMLKILSNSEPEVHYVAPVFWKDSDFSSYYSADEILANSICVPLRELEKLTDDDSHQITFIDPYGFDWHSTEHESSRGDFSGTHLAATLSNRFEQSNLMEINLDYVEELHSTLIMIIEDEPQTSEVRVDSDRIPANVSGIRFLLSSYFGVELLLLREGTVQGL